MPTVTTSAMTDAHPTAARPTRRPRSRSSGVTGGLRATDAGRGPAGSGRADAAAGRAGSASRFAALFARASARAAEAEAIAAFAAREAAAAAAAARAPNDDGSVDGGAGLGGVLVGGIVSGIAQDATRSGRSVPPGRRSSAGEAAPRVDRVIAIHELGDGVAGRPPLVLVAENLRVAAPALDLGHRHDHRIVLREPVAACVHDAGDEVAAHEVERRGPAPDPD